MQVLFSRRPNDFEHVYELTSPPRVGEGVGLLDSPADSFARQYIVTAVHWAPDHTGYDVSVTLLEIATGRNKWPAATGTQPPKMAG